MKTTWGLILLCLNYCSGLGWHDVCNITKDLNTCYIWPNNPAPFNQIASFVSPGSVCDQSCKIILSSADIPCFNLTDCARYVSGNGIHNLLDAVSIESQSLSIQSQDNNMPATIKFANIMGQSCIMFTVRASKVSFLNLNFMYQALCLTDKTDYPIYQVPLLFQQGKAKEITTLSQDGQNYVNVTGTEINLNSISTNSKIATVAVLGTTDAALNLMVKDITMGTGAQGTFPILLLNINLTEIVCDNYDDIFYVSRRREATYTVPQYPNCSNFLKSDYAAVYSGIDLDPFECKPSVVKKEPCAKQGPQLLILFIIFIVLATGGLIFVAAQYFHPSAYLSTRIRKKQ